MIRNFIQIINDKNNVSRWKKVHRMPESQKGNISTDPEKNMHWMSLLIDI